MQKDTSVAGVQYKREKDMKPEAMTMCAHDIILASWAYHTNTTDLGAETTEIFFSWFWSLEV